MKFIVLDTNLKQKKTNKINLNFSLFVRNKFLPLHSQNV